MVLIAREMEVNSNKRVKDFIEIMRERKEIKSDQERERERERFCPQF